MLKLLSHPVVSGLAALTSIAGALISAAIWIFGMGGSAGAHAERDKQAIARIEKLETQVASMETPRPDVARQQCAKMASDLASARERGRYLEIDDITAAMNNLGCHRAF
jgi:hypothetical protein